MKPPSFPHPLDENNRTTLQINQVKANAQKNPLNDTLVSAQEVIRVLYMSVHVRFLYQHACIRDSFGGKIGSRRRQYFCERLKEVFSLVDLNTYFYKHEVTELSLSNFTCRHIFYSPSSSYKTIVAINASVTLPSCDVCLARTLTGIVTVPSHRPNEVTLTLYTALPCWIPVVFRNTRVTAQTRNTGQTKALAITGTLEFICTKKNKT